MCQHVTDWQPVQAVPYPWPRAWWDWLHLPATLDKISSLENGWMALYTMMQTPVMVTVDVSAILILAGFNAELCIQTQKCLLTVQIHYSVLSPCSRVDVVAVHVVHQAVLVVAKCLVSPVDEHVAAGLIVHTAVAITSPNHSTPRRHNLPRVRPWDTNTDRGERGLTNAAHSHWKIKVDHLKSFWCFGKVALSFPSQKAKHF